MAKKPASDDRCGIIMPIGVTEGYPTNHWNDVKEILQRAAKAADLTATMVSDAEGVTIIHKTIVQNVYSNRLVICDVSSRNPNVMIELGMRLAFGAPVVIVKDDETAYPFDATSIEYIQYPKDLRFNQIESFSKRLSDKIASTLNDVKSESYQSFLQTFGAFETVKLDEKEVPGQDFIINELKELRSLIVATRSTVEVTPPFTLKPPGGSMWRVQRPLNEVNGLIARIRVADPRSRVHVSELDDHVRLGIEFSTANPVVTRRVASLLEDYGAEELL